LSHTIVHLAYNEPLHKKVFGTQQQDAGAALTHCAAPRGALFEVNMQGWKKAIVFGSIGVGAVLVVTRRRPLGMAFAAAGLAVLASEYPEKFEAVWENAPEYLQKGMQIFSTLQKMGEGFAEEAERRSVSAWRDLRAQ
jgi:hypothetical protein